MTHEKCGHEKCGHEKSLNDHCIACEAVFGMQEAIQTELALLRKVARAAKAVHDKGMIIDENDEEANLYATLSNALTALELKETTSEFLQGYACALSCIVAGHGLGVEIEEALQAGGLNTKEKMREAGIDPYDVKILKPALDAIAGKTMRRTK